VGGGSALLPRRLPATRVEAWGVAPADVAPCCFSSRPPPLWDVYAARFKACVRWCLSWLRYVSRRLLLATGVGFGDGGVGGPAVVNRRTWRIQKEQIVISILGS
jgi:hypothetical protein